MHIWKSKITISSSKLCCHLTHIPWPSFRLWGSEGESELVSPRVSGSASSVQVEAAQSPLSTTSSPSGITSSVTYSKISSTITSTSSSGVSVNTPSCVMGSEPGWMLELLRGCFHGDIISSARSGSVWWRESRIKRSGRDVKLWYERLKSPERHNSNA